VGRSVGWLVGWLVRCMHIYCVLVYFAGDLNSVETYLELGSTIPMKVKCMHSYEHKYHSYNLVSSSIIIVRCTYYMNYCNYFRVHKDIMVPGSQQYMV
jgi:hypothetical protein